MGEKYKVVYEFENNSMSVSDGSGNATIMPVKGIRMIALLGLDAALVDDKCKCSTCGVLRLARDVLRDELGMRQTHGGRPELLDKRKMS